MTELSMRFETFLRTAAWLCLAFIAMATLSPIGLRPTTGWSPSIERFLAFATVGCLFAAAYPRYILFAAVVVLGAAALFEILQLFEATRHGRLFDAGVKMSGGSVGLIVGWLLARWLPRR
jgi:Ni,Fe-hydrogenase I cytochrome b subunit